jgi:glycosyltransferase involved in cell wall biosynthesis
VELVDGLEYVEVSGRSHDEVRAALGRADLVVDQLCFGIHGVLALEAMAMAKPVVCDLAPWFSERLPEGCPIILADPVTIADVLAAWRDRRPELHRVGLDSRAWVERNYDLGVVAQRLVAAYAQLPTA